MHRKWWRTSILLPGHGVQNLQLSAHVTAGIDPKDWSFFKMPPLQNASVISRTSLWLQKLLHEAHSSTIYFRPTSLPPQKKKQIGSSKNICWNLGSSSRSWGISTSGSSSTQKIDGCQKALATLMPKQQKFPVLSMVLTCSGWWL